MNQAIKGNTVTLKNYSKKIKNWVFIFLSIITVQNVFAQLDTEHYFAPVFGFNNNMGGQQWLYLSTPSTTPITVNVTDGAGNAVGGSPITVSNAAPFRIEIASNTGTDFMVNVNELNAALSARGLKLTSSSPFYASIRVGQDGGNQVSIVVAKGKSALGKTFRLGGPPIASGKRENDFFYNAGFMATEPGQTVVTLSEYTPGIQLYGNTLINPVGPITFTLNQGETYVIAARYDNAAPEVNRDGLLGTLVSSNKNIVITNGVNYGTTAINGNNWKDSYIDQPAPVERLGNDHILIRGNGNDDRENIVVIAHEDGTQVRTNGTLRGTLNKGDYIRIDGTAYDATTLNSYVQTSKPAYVYQVISGADNDNARGGIMVTPPFSCYLPREVEIPFANKISTNVGNGADSWLLIYTQRGSTVNVTLDGAAVTAGTPANVAGVLWDSYKIALNIANGANGHVKVTSTGPMNTALLGGSGYGGWGGSFAGYSNTPMPTRITYADTCFKSTTTFTVTADILGTVTGYRWNFGDPSSGVSNTYTVSPATSTTLTHYYASRGTYTVQTIVDRTTCNDTVRQVVNIVGPNATISGNSTICKGTPNANIQFSTSPTSAPYKFVYMPSGGATTTLTSSSTTTLLPVSSATPGVYKYYLTAFYDNGVPGCNALNDSATITVTDLPTATMSGANTVCQSSAQPVITFTGANTSAPYTFYYTMGASSQTLGPVSATTGTLGAQTTTPGTTSYSLTSVKDGNGCSSNQVSGAFNIKIEPGISGTMSGDATVCKGDAGPSITLTGSNGTANYTFSYAVDGNPQSNITSNGNTATATAFTSTAGVFTYSLTGIQDAGNSSCSSVNGTAVITVLALPTANFGNDTVVCKDAVSPNIILRGNGGGGTPYTFSYKLNSNPSIQESSIIAASTITINPSTASVGTYTYTVLRVDDSNNCSQNQSDAVIVTVRAPSTATASITSSDNRVCENDASPEITFTGNNGTAPYIFTYTTNFILNGATTHTIQSTPANSIAIQVPTNNPDTLIYILTGVQDATGIACGFANSTVEIIIDPIPNSIITAAFSDACEGGGNQPLIFEAQNVSTLPITFNYYKQVSGIDPSPIQQTPIVSNSLTYTLMVAANTLGTTVYTNGISSDNSCSSTVIGSGTASITVHPLPTASLSLSGASAVCDNSASKVRFIGATGQPPFTFSYNINGFTTKTISTAAGTYSVDLTIDTVPGTYTINLTSVKDLYSCSQAQTDMEVIRVDALPQAVSTSSTTICMNSTANVSGATASNYSSINWTKTTAGTLNNANTLTPSYAAATTDANSIVTLTMTVTGTLSCLAETKTAIYKIAVDSLALAIINGSGSSTICENASKIITVANARNGNVSWSHNGSGIISNTLTLSPTYAAATGDAGNNVLLTMTVSGTTACTNSSTATYTLHVDPLPQATTSGSATICQNAAYTLTNGQASAMYGSILWSENGQGSITSGGASIIPTYTANAADAGNNVTLTMTVTSTNSCASQNNIKTFTIFVDHLPSAVGSGSASICQGTNYTISGFNAQYGSISWSENGQGSIISGNNTLTPTYRSVTTDANSIVTLIMTVTSTNSCNVTNEKSIRTFSLQVDPVPGATVNPVGAAICQNNSYTLQNGEAQQQYGSVLWTKENAAGSITNPTSLTPRYAAHANDAETSVTLRMTVTSTNSCKPQSTFKLYTLQIDSLPRAIKGQDATICYNETAVIAGAGIRNGTIQWTKSNNASGILNNANMLVPSYEATIDDAGKTILLTLTVTSNNTCVNNPPSTKTHSVIVRPLLSASLTLSKPAVCQNEEAKVFITANNGTGNYEFTYSEEGEEKTIITNNNSKTATRNITLIPNSRSIALIKIKDAHCENAATGTQTLTVYSLPDASITGDDPACRGDEKQPVVVLTGENTIAPYKFDYTVNNETAFNQTTLLSNSYSLNVSTEKAEQLNYVLKKVTDGRGCSVNITNQKSKIDIYEVPQASFFIKEMNKTILEPEIEIQNNSVMAIEYTWDYGDGNKSYMAFPESYTYKDTGYYKISLYVANGICKDTMIQTVRIKQPTLIYIPNSFTPNDDGFNDTFLPKGEGIETFEMMIFDRWGSMVFYSNDLNIGWNGKSANGELVQTDVYTYTINVKSSANKFDYTNRGIVNLIR
jgi:gliding motility-associated-like protein